MIKEFSHKNKISFFISFFAIFSFSNCAKERQTYLEFINNSTSELTVCASYKYPDTSLTSDTFGGSYIIHPLSKESLASKNGWDSDIKHNTKNNYLTLFVFSSDTLAKYNIDQVISGYKILKRYDYNLANLKSMDWTISYQ